LVRTPVSFPGRGRAPHARGLGVDLEPLARPVRRDEGRGAKRLKELDAENARLKKIVADQALDIDMLEEPAEGNF
jgi:hypothetical protein